MKRNIILLFIAFFHVDQLFLFAQTNNGYADQYVKTITAEELKAHLTILASDEYEGRETGQRGQKKAAEYLANYYAQLGAQPQVNGSWFQQYPLKKESYLKSFAKSQTNEYAFIKDFYFFSAEVDKIELDEIVFVGYGIDDPKYSDYKKKVDVTGKTVICLNGEPAREDGKNIITGNESTSEWSDDWSLKMAAAAKRGAKCLLIVNMKYDQYINRVRYWLEQSPMRLDRTEEVEVGEKQIPLIFISPAMANEIMAASGKTVEKMQLKIQKKSRTVQAKATSDLVFHMERNVERLTAENVLCYIEGSDPVLKNEVVVISAHYDHIGIVNGQINNGADDDGSGTVSTLELAEAFMKAKSEGHGTRRSILILNVSGEEKGLLGSEWYSSHPVFPLEQTDCDLNIDMIGRQDDLHTDPNYVYLIGSDKLSTDLHKISEECNSTKTHLKLDYTYNDPNDPNRFYFRSDHYNFAKHGVPVIFYFSGVHADYHKPGDDVEKILFDKMETIVHLVFYTAWEVANRDEKLKVDVKNNFEED